MPALPQVGLTELLIIMTIILAVLPGQLPELARSLGRDPREFRKELSEASHDDRHSVLAHRGRAVHAYDDVGPSLHPRPYVTRDPDGYRIEFIERR